MKLIRLTPSSITAFSIAVVALTGSIEGAQSTGIGGGHSARTPVLLPGGSSSVSVENVAGMLYWGDGSSALVGHTFNRDPDTGNFVYKKALFVASMNDDTGPGSGQLQFGLHVSANVEVSRQEIAAHAAYNALTVQAAANFAQTSEVMNGTVGASSFLGIRVEYPNSIVDLGSIPVSSFPPDARAALSAPPQSRAALWEQAGYGKYVAIGYALRGALDIDFTASNMDDVTQRSRYFDFSAKYMSVSVGANFSQVLLDSITGTAMHRSMSAYGLQGPMPPLPTDGQIWNEAQLNLYLNSLWQTALTAKAPKGLYLVSATAITDGPSFDIPLWDEVILHTAAEVALDTMTTLSSASRWNHPTRLQEFIDARTYPGSMSSYWTVLNQRRSQVRLSLQSLANAIRAYMLPALAGDPALRSAIFTGYQQVIQDRNGLDEVLARLDELAYSLPPMTLVVQENTTPSGAGPASWHWVHYTVTVDNAFVPRTSYDDVMQWALQYFGGPTLRVFEDNTLDIYGCNLEKNTGPIYGWDGPCIRNVMPSPPSVHPTGPSRGLSSIVLNFDVWNADSATEVRVKLVDDMGRQVTLAHNLYD